MGQLRANFEVEQETQWHLNFQSHRFFILISHIHMHLFNFTPQFPAAVQILPHFFSPPIFFVASSFRLWLLTGSSHGVNMPLRRHVPSNRPQKLAARNASLEVKQNEECKSENLKVYRSEVQSLVVHKGSETHRKKEPFKFPPQISINFVAQFWSGWSPLKTSQITFPAISDRLLPRARWNCLRKGASNTQTRANGGEKRPSQIECLCRWLSQRRYPTRPMIPLLEEWLPSHL